MKKTLAASLVLGALATIAAGSVMAGQIQASSVSIAREVITTDTQTVIAPSISYRFFGDVDAKVQKQTFQVQFTLGAGEWAVAPTAGAISITDGVTGVIQDQSTSAPVAPAVAAYQVTNIDLSADNKTVWATIEVAQAATALIKQPIIALNVTSNTITGSAIDVSAQRGTVQGLYTVVGDLLNDYNTAKKCVDVKTLPVSFKHYVALTNPGAMASDATATADEHTRQTSTNAATLITFPTNLQVAFTKGANAISLAPGGNQTFTGPAWVAKNAFVDANNALLGDVHLVQNALAYDGNLTNEYSLANTVTPAGVKGRARATGQIGEVEAKNLRVTVSATEGYVVGGTLALNKNSNCAVATRIGTTGTVAITAANAAGPITLLHPTAGLNATFGAAGTNSVYVCYTVPGSTMIPSSSFSVEAQLIKADPGAAPNDEQDNICNSDYISLGGGLKIDVRNYASSKEKASSGYESVIRLINNSDSRKADVWAQIIHQDGKLGGWGKIADLPVRGVKNMSASEIEALLTNAPTATQPVALGEANGAIAPTADGKQAPRLRITSNSGTTLRVQNYHYNHVTNQLLEVSGAQGVDFENLATNRVPPTAVDAQPVAQDALSGLNLKN